MKVYLGSHRSRRTEPAGLCGLREQVTEAKEGSLEIRRRNVKVMPLREKVEGEERKRES